MPSKRSQMVSGFLRVPPPDPTPKLVNGVPTSRPTQKFRGVDGKMHSAPAGSGPLNPLRIQSKGKRGYGPKEGPYGSHGYRGRLI